MIIKRITAHIINKVIIFIPSILLIGGISLVIAPNYFILGKDESGWLILYLFRYMAFLPIVFLDLIKRPLEFLEIINIILPTLMCFVIIDIMSIAVMKRDIGMKIMRIKIVSTNNKPLHLLQIIVRTLIKYFTLAFLPFTLAYIFLNKERLTLHDKIASTKVVLR